jgi:hypothetical protein
MPENKEAVETHEGFIALDRHQKDVNVQHKKFRDTERLLSKSDERANSLAKELEELKSSSVDLTIPPVPDQYSDNFETDIAKRDEAVKRKAEYDAQQERIAADQKRQDDAKVAESNTREQEQIATFDKNMVTLGLNPIEVKAAADTILGYGISDGLSDFILEDPDGPLLVQYLKDNPVELESMNSMSTLSLYNHINADVRAKASLLKPKTSNAPNPPIVLDGGGAPESPESWEKGAVYE